MKINIDKAECSVSIAQNLSIVLDCSIIHIKRKGKKMSICVSQGSKNFPYITYF